MIVVDLGCHTHGDQQSILPLIARFQPKLLLGFDPHPETIESIEAIGGTLVVTTRKAAWMRDGTVPIHVDGTRTRIAGDGDQIAQTFDLAAFLFVLPRVPIILKVDVEGAEHDLLPHLRHRHADELLDRILVEWHGEPIAVHLACPVEDWK